MRKITILAFAVMILAFAACKKSSNTLQPSDLKTKFEVDKIPSKPGQAAEEQVPVSIDTSERCLIIEKYQLPLPFDILDPDILGKPVITQLFPADSVDRFISITQKAFFDGVYTSDMVYTLVYNYRTLFVEYYANIVRLSQDLGIKQTFTTEYLRKFQENFQKDSAQMIVKQAITKTCRFLDQTNQIAVLPFMIVGSWVESMYLIIGNALNNQNVPDRIYQTIANQQTTVDKLQNYIQNSMLDVESFQLSEKLKGLSDNLDSLKTTYSRIYNSGSYTIDRNSLETLQKAYNRLKIYYANQ